MLIIEEVHKEAIIRIHNDFVKNDEESWLLLEQSYKLALLEIYSNTKDSIQ